MMNTTCKLSLEHTTLWAIEAFMGANVPAYPTSIRGTSNQRGVPGNR